MPWYPANEYHKQQETTPIYCWEPEHSSRFERAGIGWPQEGTPHPVLPQHLLGDPVMSLLQVHKTHVDRMSILPGPLHDPCRSKELVRCFRIWTKPTLLQSQVTKQPCDWEIWLQTILMSLMPPASSPITKLLISLPLLVSAMWILKWCDCVKRVEQNDYLFPPMTSYTHTVCT